MGGCVGIFKTVDGPNPEESKATNDTKNGEAPIEVKSEDVKINENDEEKDDKEAFVDTAKDLIPGNDNLKQEAVAEPEQRAEEKNEKNDDVLKGEVASA